MSTLPHRISQACLTSANDMCAANAGVPQRRSNRIPTTLLPLLDQTPAGVWRTRDTSMTVAELITARTHYIQLGQRKRIVGRSIAEAGEFIEKSPRKLPILGGRGIGERRDIGFHVAERAACTGVLSVIQS